MAKRTKVNLGHYHLTSMNFGELIPIGAVEVLPGDTFQHSTSALVRVTPQLKPIMHPTHVHIHHFFVPNRIIWSGWEDFITGDSATPPPTITGSAHTQGTLSDYLGVYNDSSNDFSALPVRAYNSIYNTYYADQDLDTDVPEDTNTIQKVRFDKDYFTAARPWAQKGTSVTLPLGTQAPIATDAAELAEVSIHHPSGSEYNKLNSTTTYLTHSSTTGTESNKLYADLSNATAADIREFREALALQRYQEARARYGSDYIDYLAYCGVNTNQLDARLQRPEYLGGGKQTLAFSEVINQSGTGTQGDLTGHGIAALRSNTYRKYFPEHGWVLTLMFIRPKSIYVNGLPRKFSKTTKEDYYQKELADVGAQEILNKEVYAAHTTPDGTFGYSNRYEEYFSEQSRVSSEFRNSTSYDWHFGRIFTSDPALNSTFIECDPSKRSFADQTNNSFWVMANHDLRARRYIKKSNVGRVA